ncbi:MAG: gliding motility-associated C-terminal domain-containing protein [Saprospiraceae bacterium]|nr:gliding motility-associated C-terminal domain-containing protein [Saprospiraceae bacterium]MCF8250146.1 gliding motility-associated C-terminal domain-containing protein [Saprospiraceae bacterium]MCF8279410.1 gliding motility-associated C-terminal domain-containing protein [Bacteroidales bacterium]MCF8311200.1 gliding motility-associated C-terminal domain-containing protein [Saprospiraceae bacterium]MCF8440419.1 gliding motility-associated C-terminal domain-containing protein [Saprospiraceae 
MRTTLTFLASAFLLSFCGLPLCSQNVTITYVNPPDMAVCDTALFEVTVANSLATPLQAVELTAVMPAGLAYLPGSITNATEANIGNPSAPKFSLPEVLSGDSHTIFFRAKTQCSLIGPINAGDLFTNTYNLAYTGGTKSVTTMPYVLETALLQAIGLNAANMSGTSGDVIVRTWTLTNTRLGALSKIKFRDAHGSGISVSSAQGTTVTNTSVLFELELGPADFQAIGDGDGLFELNEQIVITESILITSCGTPNSAVSNLTAEWGCHGEVCQAVSATATVVIMPPTNNPNVTASFVANYPSDYCALAGNQQTLQLTNTGNLPATNVWVHLDHFGNNIMGLDPATISVTVGGVTVAIMPTWSGQVQFSGCANTGTIFDAAEFIIPTILPGQVAIVQWESYLCAVECGDEIAVWRYEFQYAKTCPEDLSGQGSGSSSGGGPAVPVDQSVTYYIGQFLEDGGIYELTYSLQSPLLVDSVGVLRITFDLPCGITWANNSGFELAGQSPDSVDITTTPTGGGEVILYFTMPLGVDTVSSSFFIGYKCAEECTGPLPPCITEFVTSCPVLPEAGKIGEANVNVNTTLLLQESQCGPQDCEDFDLLWFCEASTNEICYDTILGYFVPVLDFHRENVGTPDNNNDRFEDATGNLNENLIRRDRVLAGDTVHTHVDAAMVIDVPGASIPNAAVVVNFEAHTMDFGWDGGDTLHVMNDFELLMNGIGFQNLGGEVHIVDVSTGQSFDCPLPPPISFDTLEGEIAVVNTRPLDVIDKWTYLQYQYDITPALLAQQGCPIPANFEFAQGDSVVMDVYHKTRFNIGPYVANLRTVSGVFAWNPPGPHQVEPFICYGNFKRWQYSGYRYTIGSGQYNMPPCETSSLPGGTYFTFRIGKDNFFPFEFRSFAHLAEWRYNVPPQGTLLSAVMKKLEIQSGIIAASNVPITWTQSGNIYEFDVANLQNPLVDEGFLMEFGHEWELSCTEEHPLLVDINAVIDFAPSIPVQSNPLILNVHALGMLNPIRPNLALNPVNTDFSGFSNTAVWDFLLTNNSADNVPASNSWMTITSMTGLLSDFVLVNTTTGATITPNNGIYQLGNLPQGWQNDFQLQATIGNCQADEVLLTYGWSCEPFTVNNPDTCTNYQALLTVHPIIGELEMEITSPSPTEFELCDTIPYHEVEVFNAQIGTVTDVVLRAQMPAGMFIMAGSCQIAYPTGTAWLPIPDPVDLGNGGMEWNLSALNAQLGSTGLTGFDQPPTHSVSVRFRSGSECGFVSPSQIIFNTEALQGCGMATNELSKPGAPLFIEGVTPLYQTNINIGATAPPVVSCGSSILVEVTMEADATIAPTDSVFVILPPGLAYIPGSYVPGSNAVANGPLIDFSNGEFRLKWQLQPGLPPFTSINFSLQLSVLPGGGCDSLALEIATFQLQTAVCSVTGEACEVLAQTGSETLPIGIVLPALALSDLQVTQSNGLTEYSVLLENNGGNATDPIIVNLYFDADGSGTFTPGDQLLDTQNWPGGLPSGATQALIGSLNLAYDQLCQLIAVVNADDNCTCSEDVESAIGNIVNVMPPQTVCGSTEVEIGIPNQPGHTYQWQPADLLECPTCPTTNFQANELNAPVEGVEVTLTLLDDNGMGCTISNSFTMNVGGQSISAWGTIFICEGGTFNYGPPPPGGSQSWSSNHIFQNDEMNYVLTFFEPGGYYQSIIDSFGCATGFELGVTFSDAFSIDTLGLCNGDSVVIDGIPYFDAVSVCDTTFSPAGCEIIHCIYYQASDGFDIDFPLDTVCTFDGIPVVINTAPGGFAGYLWTGSDLSCNDCPQPTAPGVTQNYAVTITDSDGCSVSGDVTVLVLLGCAVGGMEMPNAFSPNEDGKNDFFRPAFASGVEKIVETASMRIFDRWGNLVFEGDGPDVKWDGKINGKPAASDVYIFLLEMTCSDDEVVVRGDVTLLR